MATPALSDNELTMFDMVTKRHCQCMHASCVLTHHLGKRQGISTDSQIRFKTIERL